MTRTRYEKAANRLLDLLEEHRGEILPMKWPGPVYQWAEFCILNPGAQSLVEQVNREFAYELSDYQCSWAAVQFSHGTRDSIYTGLSIGGAWK